jgi:dihydrolipoamide dehydrogenase
MSESYDVVVIGAGPAGYPAAIRAAQLKLKAACVDEWKNTDGTYTFGGTCLNAGCIPSKALLESSELYLRAKSEFAVHGIQVADVKLDLAQMQKRRAGVVKTMTQGIAALFKANGVVGIPGHGKLLEGNKVLVTAPDGSEKTLQAKHVILASGSTPIRLPGVPHDGKFIIDSWNALELDAVPARLGVIGAGVIGLELGSVWRRLGSEVTVLEALPDFLPMVDQTLAKEALRHFKRQGLDIKLGAKVARAAVSGAAVSGPAMPGPAVPGAAVSGSAVDVVYTDAQGEHTLQVDKLIVAVGRRPFTHHLLGEGTGVELDARGFVRVDEHCRTGAPNVWAIGDVVRGPMLAHKGKEEGIMAAELIAGRYGEVNYKVIPSVIYTAPEIAWVGQTEEQVKAAGRAYKVGVFPFAASGRARAMEQAQGMAKVVSAKDDDEILGVHVIGPMAGELIGEAVLAMEYSASTEDLQRTIHAHPTLSEAIHEAALAADKIAIDSVNR